MRVRTRIEGSNKVLHSYYVPPILPGNDVAYHHTTRWKQMTDVSSKWIDRKEVNPCQFFETTLRSSPGIQPWINGYYDDNGVSRPYYGYWDNNAHFYPGSSVLASMTPDPNPLLVSIECINAIKAFRTQIPEELSIANFIYELKDFKELIKGLAETFKDRGKNLKGLTRKDLAKYGNNTFLSYHFAWTPFISDLRKIVALFDKILNRIKYLKSINGKRVKLHYRKLDFYKRELPTKDHPYGDTSEYTSRLECTSLVYNFYSTVDLYCELENLDTVEAKFRATLAALGLNNPFAVVWNAIPFSFMLDWLLPIGSFLELFSLNPFVGKWQLANSTTTTEVVSSCNAYRVFKPQYNSNEKYASYDCKLYNRRLGFPITVDNVFQHLSGLTAHQISLIASIIIGNTVLKDDDKKRRRRSH